MTQKLVKVDVKKNIKFTSHIVLLAYHLSLIYLPGVQHC